MAPGGYVRGDVRVTAGSDILLTGPGTQITASSHGTRDAGTVEVSAGTITIQGGAQIASATYGAGRGGDVRVTAGSDILLTGPGPQITASSHGTGDAGSILIGTGAPTPRLSLRDGASISTEVSTEALSANGGNIAISLSDMLHLQRSSITTSVKSARGNGGNIAIDPRFVVLDQSQITAEAVGGNGGNIRIWAGQFVQSAGSVVSATSQLGISGQIAISGPPVNLTGSLVVLSSELRAAAAVLSESCAARGARPRSSLAVAGRGGLRHDPETTLPALYIADRSVRAGEEHAPEVPAAPPRHTSVTLSTRCE
jgi:hypothetical protein